MVDFRLYRIAFAPALLAFVALMFSLQGIPAPLEPATPPAAFDPDRAAATARAIVSRAPDRPPGSDGDEAIAALVAQRFATVRTGTVSEQQVSASFDGDGVAVRNVILTLPGDSPATVVVVAGRDSARGPGAASSAAATGALVELAATLGVSSHRKTYVLASTSGGTGGAGSTRGLIDSLADADTVEAVLVLSQPGAANPRPPFVVASSTGPNRTAAQLDATAARAVSAQAQHDDGGPSTLGQLSRLAFPSGLGEQAPLIDAGIDAIAISSAGERPLAPADDGPDDLSAEVLGGFGHAATTIVQALDVGEEPLRHGPEPYLETGDNLVPGWAIALLALALLTPALVAAVDAVARSLRRSEELGAALTWAAARALPAVAGLGALYALALGGLVPRPSFPFDPGRYDVGAAAVVALVLIVGAIGAGAVLLRRVPRPDGVPRSSLVAALGAVSVVAGLLAWLANPYLGLLLVPAVHAWLVGAAGARAAVATAAVAAALLPVALALDSVASALELGTDAPWTFLLMVADGQIGLWVALSLCLLTGALAGTVAACRHDPGVS